MRQKSLDFYRNGLNCSQCLLCAFEEKYNIPLPADTCSMCSAVNNGLGIGSTCCVLVAGIMCFGLMFDAPTAKRLRLLLLDSFYASYQCLNCSQLLCQQQGDENICEKVIADVADLVERLINSETEGCA